VVINLTANLATLAILAVNLAILEANLAILAANLAIPANLTVNPAASLANLANLAAILANLTVNLATLDKAVSLVNLANLASLVNKRPPSRLVLPVYPVNLPWSRLKRQPSRLDPVLAAILEANLTVNLASLVKAASLVVNLAVSYNKRRPFSCLKLVLRLDVLYSCGIITVNFYALATGLLMVITTLIMGFVIRRIG